MYPSFRLIDFNITQENDGYSSDEEAYGDKKKFIIQIFLIFLQLSHMHYLHILYLLSKQQFCYIQQYSLMFFSQILLLKELNPCFLFISIVGI